MGLPACACPFIDIQRVGHELLYADNFQRSRSPFYQLSCLDARETNMFVDRMEGKVRPAPTSKNSNRPTLRSLPDADAVSLLEDDLCALREVHGEVRYPRSARQYLEDWSGGQTPYLRKYYPELGDEPEFDLTPATAKAVEWIQGLEERQVVGTESRLLSVLALLREIVHHTEDNPERLIQALGANKRRSTPRSRG
jgi:hypothetical protein